MVCCTNQVKLRAMDNVLNESQHKIKLEHESRCSYCGKLTNSGTAGEIVGG